MTPASGGPTRGPLLSPLMREVLRLAVPLMGANLAQTMLSWTDTAMVGRLGEAALAAMGPASVFFLIIFLVVSAGFMGVQAMVARRYGEGSYLDCGRVFDHGFLIALFTGLIGGVAGLIWSDEVCAFLIDDPEIARMSADYLVVRWGGVGLLTMFWSFKGFYFGIGVTRIDLVLAVVMNLVNVVLNWIFIYGNLGAPELGLAGAAWASLGATAIAVAAYAVISLGPEMRRRYGLFRFRRPDPYVLRRLIELSLPRALSGLAFGGCILYFKLIGDHAGETALAASTVIWRFFGTSVLISIAIGTAAATVVGHALGAGDDRRAERGARAAVKLGFFMNLGVGGLVMLAPELVMRIFTDEPEVIAAGAGPLRLVCAFLCLDSIGIVLSRVLTAAGCVVYVMVMEYLVSLGLMLPVAWFLCTRYPDDLAIIWLAWVTYILGWALAMSAKFLAGGWKHVRI